MREHLSEGRARLETVRTMAGLDFPKERARVSLFLGALATAQGDYKAAEGFLKEGLSLYEELDDEPGIAASLNALAISTRDGGDLVAAQTNFERSLACWRLLSDRSAVARCLHNLANVVRARDDYPRARWALGEATEIFQELGDLSGAAWSTNQLGDIAHATGDIAGARLLYERALTIFRDAGDPWGSARSLADLGLPPLRAGESFFGERCVPRSARGLRRIGASAGGCASARRVCMSGGRRRTGRTRANTGSGCNRVAETHQRSSVPSGAVPA